MELVLFNDVVAGDTLAINNGAFAELRTFIIDGSERWEISAKIPRRFISLSII